MASKSLLASNAAVLALVLAFVTPTLASASSPPDETEDLAAISAEVNPDAADVVSSRAQARHPMVGCDRHSVLHRQVLRRELHHLGSYRCLK